VWRALTDYTQFGEWFHVRIDNPFQPGQVASGQITHPGYEHLQWQVTVQKIEPEHTFSFTWHPYAIDPAVDYSAETPTLVEFTLEPISTGTRLTVTESGFDHIPAHRRAEAFRMNSNGWAAQITNIQTYVANHP
ncbi:MAG: SRPBCC family protein, partial [Acidobacteriaceae bacterium]